MEGSGRAVWFITSQKIALVVCACTLIARLREEVGVLAKRCALASEEVVFGFDLAIRGLGLDLGLS